MILDTLMLTSGTLIRQLLIKLDKKIADPLTYRESVILCPNCV